MKLALGRMDLVAAQLLVSLCLLSSSTAFAAGKPPETTEDGLKLVKVKGVDMAYVRPGATLAPYKRVMVDPVQVAFSKEWDPEKAGSRMKLSQEEREKIRTGLGNLFNKTFKEELEKKNGYPVVTEPGPDVLRVTPALVEVYANAPDTMEPGRTYTFTVSAGSATLIGELRDSETGQILARFADQQEARSDGFLRLSSSVENSAEARSMVSHWARILRSRLDKVKAEPAAQ
ncbi:MAG TPA: DUF3313 family protein [Steroidobacteraceae bacterium]|nr:DUF3313 family protein [Steroidobacteraceae bacterium]